MDCLCVCCGYRLHKQAQLAKYCNVATASQLATTGKANTQRNNVLPARCPARCQVCNTLIKLLVNSGGCGCELVNLIGCFQIADVYRFKVLTWPILNIFTHFGLVFIDLVAYFPREICHPSIFLLFFLTFCRVREEEQTD